MLLRRECVEASHWWFCCYACFDIVMEASVLSFSFQVTYFDGVFLFSVLLIITAIFLAINTGVLPCIVIFAFGWRL